MHHAGETRRGPIDRAVDTPRENRAKSCAFGGCRERPRSEMRF